MVPSIETVAIYTKSTFQRLDQSPIQKCLTFHLMRRVFPLNHSEWLHIYISNIFYLKFEMTCNVFRIYGYFTKGHLTFQLKAKPWFTLVNNFVKQA